jgi:hypothetical protein
VLLPTITPWSLTAVAKLYEPPSVPSSVIFPADGAGGVVAPALADHGAVPVDAGGDSPAPVDVVECAEIDHPAAPPPERV